MSEGKRTRIVKYIGTVLALGLFIYLLSRQDWNSVISLMAEVEALPVLIVFLLYIASIASNGFRWFSLLQNARINFSLVDSITTTFLGGFISNFMPSTIGGDSVRFLYLMKFDNRKDICLASLVIDRLLNIVLMGLFFPFALLRFFPEMDDLISTLRSDDRGFIKPYLIAGTFGFIGDFWRKISQKVRKFLTSYRFFFYSPGSFLIPLSYAILSLLLSFSGTYLMASELSIKVNFFEVAAISSLVYIFTLIPISFNGLGIRELIMTTLYLSVGASIEQATTLTLLTRLLMILVSSIGFIWFGRIMSGIKLSKLFD